MHGDKHPDVASRELRSFGRKRGRKISARQESLLRDLLPRVSVDLGSPAPRDLCTLFPTATSEVWLEIGFGGAEHMIAQARANPHVAVIGCEPFEEGVVKALAAIADGGLGNIRLHADDARPLLRWLPAASLARAFILFPDPWPKKRHAKRRLFSAPVLDELARVMRPGGELRFATDWGDYARHALYAAATQKSFSWAAASPADWRQRPPDWPQTRYETKAIAQGRRSYFFRFIRQAAE